MCAVRWSIVARHLKKPKPILGSLMSGWRKSERSGVAGLGSRRETGRSVGGFEEEALFLYLLT
jgi:hypothetical protein